MLDSPRPHPQGHHHALPKPSREKTPFQSIISWACSNISSSTKGMPTCLHEEVEEEITLPGLERRAPADHWPESWRFRKEQGSGRWEAGYWRVLRLAALSKKQPQNLNPVLQHNTLKARNRGRKKREDLLSEDCCSSGKNCNFMALFLGLLPAPAAAVKTHSLGG